MRAQKRWKNHRIKEEKKEDRLIRVQKKNRTEKRRRKGPTRT